MVGTAVLEGNYTLSILVMTLPFHSHCPQFLNLYPITKFNTYCTDLGWFVV